MFLYWRVQYCENDYTTQSNLQIQCNHCQITNGIFHRIRAKIFTIFCPSSMKNDIGDLIVIALGRLPWEVYSF